MGLFSELAGLKGENFASAMLAYLLRSSDRARSAFIELIEDESHKGPFIVDKQFAVFTEVSFIEAATERRRRIDILLQTDNAVIGIENKFGAGFQDNQPKCYQEQVVKLAKNLHDVWGASYQPLLIVLAPSYRSREVKKQIIDQNITDSCFVVSWRDLLSKLHEKHIHASDSVEAFLMGELAAYVEDFVGKIDVSLLIRHLDRHWVPQGSPVIRSFFYSLVYPLLDEQLTKNTQHGSGNHHHGYYLLIKKNGKNPWIGFCDSMQLGDRNVPGAKLVVAFGQAEERDRFCQTEYGEPEGLWHSEGFFSASVRHDKSWIGREQWEAPISEINSILLESADQEST